MPTDSPTVMRCERCKAVISAAQAVEMVRHGELCGVCGGRLTLCDRPERGSAPTSNGTGASSERRLLSALRDADGEPVGPEDLREAGIEDPAGAIFELEQVGYRIVREYADAAAGRRRLIGFRLT